MKILILSDTYGLKGTGLGIHVSRLAEELQKRCHKVLVVTPSKNEDLKINNNIKVKYLPYSFSIIQQLFRYKDYRFPPPYPDPIFVKKLKSVISKFKPDVIHCHEWITIQAVSARTRSMSTPIISTWHDYGFIRSKRTKIKNRCLHEADKSIQVNCPIMCGICSIDMYGFKSLPLSFTFFLYRKYFSKVDHIIAVSNYLKRIIIKPRILDETNISVIYNFVNAEKSERYIIKTFRTKRVIDMLYIGGPSKIKGFQVLLKCLRILEKQGMKLRVLFVGFNAQNYNWLPSIFSKIKIKILERIPQDEVFRLMSLSRLVIIPSKVPETFSLATLDAMSVGTPVIASILVLLGRSSQMILQDI